MRPKFAYIAGTLPVRKFVTPNERVRRIRETYNLPKQRFKREWADRSVLIHAVPNVRSGFDFANRTRIP